jgi:hypothetical protein
MKIDKESSEKVIDKMKGLWSDKVSVVDFPEKEETIEKSTVKDWQSKHDVRIEKTNRPIPELKPDKALMVVVCPALTSRNSPTGGQFKVHANDRVVAVNHLGTYTFFYLDPGEYLLVSQTRDASGFKIKVEAGKDYYFLQNLLWAHMTFSRHSKELVLHEMSGAYYSNWKRKD